MLKHTDKWWHDKYIEFANYTRREQVNFPFANEEDFKKEWKTYHENGIKNISRRMKYDIKYETDYKTAQNLYKHLKDTFGQSPVSLEEIKIMSTHDFADKYHNEIMADYRQKRKEGLSGKDAGRFISEYWFGSP